jgi:hypothetical protein
VSADPAVAALWNTGVVAPLAAAERSLHEATERLATAHASVLAALEAVDDRRLVALDGALRGILDDLGPATARVADAHVRAAATWGHADADVARAMRSAITRSRSTSSGGPSIS